MDDNCKYKKCLKYINPEENDLHIGIPYTYEKPYMACFLCQDNYKDKLPELEEYPYPIKKEI